MLQHVDDAYEVYWNGELIGRCGALPPHPTRIFNQRPHVYTVKPARENILAVRVWKQVLWSTDTSDLGGFYQSPRIGLPDSIEEARNLATYQLLNTLLFFMGLECLSALIALLSICIWLRDRTNFPALALAGVSGSSALNFLMVDLPLNATFLSTYLPDILVVALHDIAVWFLLLYLFDFAQDRDLLRYTKWNALMLVVFSAADVVFVAFNSNPRSESAAQMVDAGISIFITIAQAFPVVLLVRARHKKLERARWIVAITAVLAEMLLVIPIWFNEGIRYTHWTITSKLTQTLFTIQGAIVSAPMVAELLLLLSVIYAVYSFVRASSKRQQLLEIEMRNAREIQRVLIPEETPSLKGFRVSSSYTPASDVGGDFFQIIPLHGDGSPSNLIVLGDVSGKGLRAAMTVSAILGVLQVLTESIDDPGRLLSELNQRMCGRMSGGFATCIVLRFGSDGRCSIASAGHPSPFLNGEEVLVESSLPIGILASTSYPETELIMQPGDRIAIYTDGLLEARNREGELYGFDRLKRLFSTDSSAQKAAEVAIDFGQDDDITVLTLTRSSEEAIPAL